MNKRLGDLTIRNLMILYVILYTVMPIVSRLTSQYLTTYFYMAVVVVLVVLVLVLDKPDNFNKYITFLLPFIIYGALTGFTSNQDVIMWGYQTLLFWLPVILGFYFMQDTSNILNSYAALLIVAMIITMITTIIGCIQIPNAARMLATVTSQYSVNFDLKNIGGYNFVYYIVLLYPVLILSYKAKRIRLLPVLMMTAVIFVMIIYSEYTTALLLFILTSFLFFTSRNLSMKGIVTISVFSLLFLLVFTNVIVDFLNWLGSVINSKSISYRLSALSGGAKGLEQSEDNRIELYRMSLNRFFEHPIFGTIFSSDASYKMYGGHSFVLDTLAQYGLFGGALIFVMYKNIFKCFFLPLKEKIGYGYVVWTFIQAIILSTVNTGMWLEVLCLFAPILLHWIYKTEDVENEAVVDSQLAAGSSG